jgi:hypothetical protein
LFEESARIAASSPLHLQLIVVGDQDYRLDVSWLLDRALSRAMTTLRAIAAVHKGRAIPSYMKLMDFRPGI